SPDLYATDVLASVLGGSESSILVRRLRDETGLVLGIQCSDPTPTYVEGQLEITALCDPEKILAAQGGLFAALDDVVKNGVPPDAVERAKAQSAADLVYGNQTAEQQAIRNASDFMAAGNIDFTPMYVKRIQAVTPEQVRAAAKKFLNREKLLTTVLLPTGARNPFDQSAAQGVAVQAEPVKKTVLKNGVTLLISRNPTAPLAAVNMYVMGGLLAEDDATNGTGAMMMELMTRETESRTHEQIADFLDATGTTLGSESGSNSFHLSLQCMKEKTPAAFALFADVALHPKFSDDELKQVRQPLVAAVDSATEDWFGEAYLAIKQKFYADSPYRRLPQGDGKVINALTPAQIKAHYQNYFLDPQKMVIAISGDIDPDAAAKWAGAFESIPQKTPALHMTSRSAAPAATRVPTKKDSATIMVAYPGMTVTNPDRYALTVLQTYLGGYTSQFGSVLFDTLRGRGLVYTVQASNITGPAGGMFLISAQGEPQNADAITKAIAEIVAQTKAGDIPDVKFNAARDQAITGEKLSKLTIAEKSSDQALNELIGLGYDEDARFPERVRAVTKEQVIAAARNYLTAPVIVVMTPEQKK
ncbi:MAG TPA: insulinase family protein, partial [Phycisphaerae bacterium]|nr:insulinase family protein [Phycisphaerae bacterium]